MCLLLCIALHVTEQKQSHIYIFFFLQICATEKKVTNFLNNKTQVTVPRIHRRPAYQPSKCSFLMEKDVSVTAKNNKAQIALPFLDKIKIR